MNLLMTGLRRRKKEWRAVLIVTLIASFFMAGVLMFQNILQAYVREWDKSTYGDWVCASDAPTLSHPYLTASGHLLTGPEVVTAEGDPTGIHVGSVCDDLLAFSRIELYEGRFPKTPDEAAMDLNTLTSLGASYELGQTLTLYINTAAEGEEPALQERTVTLTGTVKPFARIWYSGSRTYPQILVTPDALPSWGTAPVETWFYQLDPALTDLDTDSFTKALHDAAEEQGIAWLNNPFVYGQTLWGSLSFSRLVIVLMIVLAVFAIGYMLRAYAGRRREGWYRLRRLGVSRRRLSLLIAAECGLATVPGAACGIGLAYLAGYLACRIIADRVGLHGVFAFNGTVFAWQLGAVLGAILLSIGLTLLGCGDKNLAAQTQALGTEELARLHDRLPRLSSPEKEVFARTRIAHAPARRLSAALAMLLTAFLILATPPLLQAREAIDWIRTTPDYTILFTDTYTFDASAVGGEVNTLTSAHSPYYGASEEDLAKLRQLPGISSLDSMCRNNWYGLQWDGLEESFFHTEWEKLPAAVNVVRSDEDLAYYLDTMQASLSEEQRRRFFAGETVILGVPLYQTEVVTTPQGVDVVSVAKEEPTLSSGKPLTISSLKTGEGLTLPMQVVYDRRPWDEARVSYGDPYSTVNWGTATLLIPESVSETLRQLEGEGTVFRDNILNFRFDPAASFEATDKMLASYASAANAEHINAAEAKRLWLQKDVIQPLLFYGSLFLMTLAVWLILEKNFAEARSRESREACRRARQIGMTRGQLNRLLTISECRHTLAIGWGFPVGLLLLYFQRLRQYGRLDGTFHSVILNRSSSNESLAALEHVLFFLPLPQLFLLTAILYVIITAFALAICRKALKKEEVL